MGQKFRRPPVSCVCLFPRETGPDPLRNLYARSFVHAGQQFLGDRFWHLLLSNGFLFVQAFWRPAPWIKVK